MNNTNGNGESQKSSLVSISSLTLNAIKLNLDTQRHFVAITHGKCSLCKSAGFRSESRIVIKTESKSISARLFVIHSPILTPGDLGLSDSAWEKLDLKEGDKVVVTLAEPLESFNDVRAKLFGKPFTHEKFRAILHDMVEGRYSDIQLASFLTACVNLSSDETSSLTEAMAETGQQLKWTKYPIVDKHCVGGLPGNRTTMIVVPIIAAYGLPIPKTSSRAITSPSGTADTMEVIAPVNLSVEEMKKVISQEGGCIVWGGSVDLSPADDVLVQVERALDLDSKSQLVASVLSKKAAAGSTHVLIDIPIGPTAKIRTTEEATALKAVFHQVGETLGLKVKVVKTDGMQPVGRGIGPALEARDVLSVLRREENAPQDLKERALFLAGKIIDMCSGERDGQIIAHRILDSGDAYKKFEAICKAQGGMKEPILGRFKHVITSNQKGVVKSIHNSHLARIAKLAGAPDNPGAGVDFHTPIGTELTKGQPLFTIYAESAGELNYALHYFLSHQEVIEIGDI